MRKGPLEIFGKKITHLKNIDKKYLGPYLGDKCNKQSRMITYPLGICSVINNTGTAIICPNRFLENDIVFTDIVTDAFGSTDNIIGFSEVKLENVGSFDFVLVKHKPFSNKILDFCIVEFQSDSTTGTGELVNAMKDLVAHKEIINNRYNFGLNTYNTIKLSYIQMLIKGQVMEKWNKSIYWILQKYVFENIISRFKLTNMNYTKSNNTKYFLYDLIEDDNNYLLKLIEKKSSTINNLLKAFTSQSTPNIYDFIRIFEKKIELKLNLKVKTE